MDIVVHKRHSLSDKMQRHTQPVQLSLQSVVHLLQLPNTDSVTGVCVLHSVCRLCPCVYLFSDRAGENSPQHTQICKISLRPSRSGLTAISLQRLRCPLNSQRSSAAAKTCLTLHNNLSPSSRGLCQRPCSQSRIPSLRSQLGSSQRPYLLHDPDTKRRPVLTQITCTRVVTFRPQTIIKGSSGISYLTPPGQASLAAGEDRLSIAT